MKKLLATVLAALAIAGCGTPSKSAPALKVGSYNIRLQTGDRGTPNAWDARKADILCLLVSLVV